MAQVMFSVVVLLIVQNVFANNCNTDIQLTSCDECIRCGATWCSEKTDEHCTFSKTDVFCGGNEEELPMIDVVAMNGAVLHPGYMERTLFIDNLDSFTFDYLSPVERKVSAHIYNSTQSFDNIEVKPDEVLCSKSKCSVKIEAQVHPDFCTSRSTTHEFIYVKLKVENITEEAVIKYHVPCACECSKKIEKKSPKCSGHGDFSCGVCKCFKGWSGENCDKLNCESKRGDVQCNNPLMNDVECSGNGYCGPCETCICYDDKEGSQYYDADNFCSDICMDSSAFGHCLTNGTVGVCVEHQMVLLNYSDTAVAETDEYNRKVWVRCNDTFPFGTDGNCYVEYFAMKFEDGIIQAMIRESCQQSTSGGIVRHVDVKVPIILGVLGVIAAVAAVAGVMLWKHMNAVPPLPFSSPDYQNIDAEDCVGENPLYKSPTTTFTNPQFGKC